MGRSGNRRRDCPRVGSGFGSISAGLRDDFVPNALPRRAIHGSLRNAAARSSGLAVLEQRSITASYRQKGVALLEVRRRATMRFRQSIQKRGGQLLCVSDFDECAEASPVKYLAGATR